MNQKVISFLGQTECSVCHSPLVLYSEERSYTELDIHGNPLYSEYDGCDSILKCENCLKEYDYVQIGNRYQIYTELQQKLDIYYIIETKIDNIKSPFVKEVKNNE